MVEQRAERVSGMDAWQLYQETKLQVGNGMSLIQVDRSAVSGDLYEHVVDTLADRIHLIPAYRNVLYDPWFNLDRPMLLPADGVDIRDHVTELAMPSPGGLTGAATALARVRATHLDFGKPLWRIYVIEDDAKYAYLISVVHHLLVDGDSAMDIMGCLFTPGDLSAEPPKRTPAAATFPARPGAIFADAVRRKMKRLYRLPALVGLSVRTWASERALRDVRVDAPRTPFNCTLSGTSTVALASMPIADLKRIGETYSVTVNHILLHCLGSALRTVLSQRDALPTKPLVAAVPYAMREADASDYVTDGVGTTTVLRVNLHDDITDPVERLQAIATHARAVKEVKERRGVNLFRQWNEYAPGWFVALLFRLIERLGLAERISWPCNVIVSNASGFMADDPVFLNLPALRFYPAGPLYHGMGPSVIAMTWMDHLYLSVTADSRHVAHAATITENVEAEFAGLLALATSNLDVG